MLQLPLKMKCLSKLIYKYDTLGFSFVCPYRVDVLRVERLFMDSESLFFQYLTTLARDFKSQLTIAYGFILSSSP